MVSITNAKIVPKGKSILFFDTAIKSAFDQHTNVAECPEDDDYPQTLPVMPNLQAMSSLATACMVSLVAAVTEEGQAVTPSQEDGIPGQWQYTVGCRLDALYAYNMHIHTSV